MKLEKVHEKLFVLIVVVVQIAVKSVVSSLSYENKKFVQIKQDPTRYQQASTYRKKINVLDTRYLNVTTSREINKIHASITAHFAPLEKVRQNYSQERSNVAHNNDKTATQANPYKKWQVGRVSRKQYEIINMLWRKTKIFADFEPTTANYNLKRSNETEKRVIDNLFTLRQPVHRFSSRPILPSTTSSYIEFYYLDETDERFKELTTQKQVLKHRRDPREGLFSNFGIFKFVADSPIFAFRINDPNYKKSPIPTRYMHPTNKLKRRRNHDSSLTGFDSLNSITPSYKFANTHSQHSKILSTTTTLKTTSNSKINHVTSNVMKNISTSEYTIDNETCPFTTEPSPTLNYTTASENITSDKINITHVKDSINEIYATASINVTHVTKPTTAYDKIKFFEMYDKNTPIPYYDEKGQLVDVDDVTIFVSYELINDHKILLEHVDQGIENEHNNPHKAKHSKKHIIENYMRDFKDQRITNNSVAQLMKKPVTPNVSEIDNITLPPIIKLLPESEVTNGFENKNSKNAEWSKYPFVAAYVYEPSQVHCDAAGISPHWLVTSGSCLSRHHKNPGGEGRSAFVTYCGEAWWNPERMAYVKYSVVHPRFHPRDKTRRHLYNIGLIKVVTSMASACNGWAPISLISHQFVADVEGSTANAIGWGLDRFDTRYSSNILPKNPLMNYKSQVFSDSCPGNVGYSKAKQLDEEGGIKNVYCLLLPPYSGEETDPVHGGLLLFGGKLVALYLQEERRPWGDQCAQYTGTWRLVPWVLDIARENDEIDPFTLEM